MQTTHSEWQRKDSVTGFRLLAKPATPPRPVGLRLSNPSREVRRHFPTLRSIFTAFKSAEGEGFEAYSFSTPLRFSHGGAAQKYRKALRIPPVSKAVCSLLPANKIRALRRYFVIAERERFELSVPFGTLVFETSALDHSATSPSPRRRRGAHHVVTRITIRLRIT